MDFQDTDILTKNNVKDNTSKKGKTNIKDPFSYDNFNDVLLFSVLKKCYKKPLPKSKTHVWCRQISCD